MTMRQDLQRGALFLLFALLCVTQLKAAEDDAVARIVIALGTVEAVAADGSVRALERGDAIYEGDTLRTGASARAQLRFTDGARMSLRPESELSVDDYEFQEAAPPARARSALGLRRGGFRTATGRIAERNRSAYRVTTPFAVIGVRGTDWSAVITDIGEGDNLFLAVDEGAITAENDGGSIDIGDGDPFSYARIRSFDSPPEGLESLPTSVAEAFESTPLPPAADDDTSGEGDDALAAGPDGGDEDGDGSGDDPGADGGGDGVLEIGGSTATGVGPAAGVALPGVEALPLPPTPDPADAPDVPGDAAAGGTDDTLASGPERLAEGVETPIIGAAGGGIGEIEISVPITAGFGQTREVSLPVFESGVMCF
ncbi:MAG: FecR family protein [Pseudomonadales bacterium]|jgi:hypothetical protein|nr:FecR family protein [Pseudomonadales bacterium]